MNGYEIFWLCCIGLCWGSFLNVVITRTLSGESIITPPSKCPKCGTRLLWWQNIPIFSYIFLRGKCHFCGEKISLQYPFVEILGAVIVIFSFTKYSSILDSISVTFILSMFLTLSYTDIKKNKVSIIQILIVSLFGIIFNRNDIINSLAGFVFASATLILISIIGLKLLKKDTFGTGDVYLIGSLGAVVGLDKLFLFLLYTLFIQFILILPGYIMSLIKAEKKEILKYLIYFALACLFLYVLRNISFFGSTIVLTVILGILIFFAWKLIKNLLTTLKTQEAPSYCPLAPAFALACLIFLC